MKTRKRIVAITLAASAGAAALAGGLFVYSGLYDVSATEQHTAFVYRLLDTSMRRSIELRTADVKVPSLDGAERISNGYRKFRSHCVQCHGAPGVAPQDFALGLMPAPAALVATARKRPAAEIYWVISNGIKMSGMPAWRYRLRDEEIWDVVAFMKTLPALSPAEYAALDERHAGPDKRHATAAQQAPAPAAASSRGHGEESGGDEELGDIAAGRKAMQQYLCATCHVIPGVVGAGEHVGPSLAGIADRRYIAGVLPNTPANMLRWLRHPTQVDPLSAMPDLGVTDQDARDIAAFLYTLRAR